MSQSEKRRGAALVRAIGCFKLLKGGALLLISSGALSLLHRDAAAVLQNWLEHLNVDPHYRYFEALIDKIDGIDGRHMALISAATFVYATIFFTEGIGLLLRQRWAEYFTVIVTGSFIPLEIYQAVRNNSVPKMIVIAINMAAVLYLVFRIRSERRADSNQQRPNFPQSNPVEIELETDAHKRG